MHILYPHILPPPTSRLTFRYTFCTFGDLVILKEYNSSAVLNVLLRSEIFLVWNVTVHLDLEDVWNRRQPQYY